MSRVYRVLFSSTAIFLLGVITFVAFLPYSKAQVANDELNGISTSENVTRGSAEKVKIFDRVFGSILIEKGTYSYRTSKHANSNLSLLAQNSTGIKTKTTIAQAVEKTNPKPPGSGEESLREVGNKQINPVSDLWSLVFQNDLVILDGDISDDAEVGNSFKFQPVLPIDITDKIRFIARPLFELVTTQPRPSINSNGKLEFGNKTGFGDIGLATVFAPAKKGTGGAFWGLGAAWTFPTATNDKLGSEKFTVGPAAVGFLFTKNWVLGMFPQLFFSYAGDSDREDVKFLNIQYFILYQLPNSKWKIGMTPNFTVNFEASDGNKVTRPVGIGLTTVVKIGKTPVRLLFEVQPSIIRPDDFGQIIGFRFLVAPVIPNLSKR